MKNLGLLGVVVGDLLGYTGAGAGIGYYAWKHWGFPPAGMIVTGLAGMTLAFYQIYLVSKRSERESEKDE